MKVINFSNTNSVLNQFVAEIRDVDIQNDRLRFRRNIERIGEIMAYEISKSFRFTDREVITPLGISQAHVPSEEVVLATILRAGIPFHNGFLNYFDNADNAFVSAYRKYKDETRFEICIEYLASPRLDGKTLLIADPMLATGHSLEQTYHALLSKGEPEILHIASIIATDQAIRALQDKLPENTTIWCADIDHELDSHSYIVPGLGDAGNLSYGEKEEHGLH